MKSSAVAIILAVGHLCGLVLTGNVFNCYAAVAFICTALICMEIEDLKK